MHAMSSGRRGHHRARRAGLIQRRTRRVRRENSKFKAIVFCVNSDFRSNDRESRPSPVRRRRGSRHGRATAVRAWALRSRTACHGKRWMDPMSSGKRRNWNHRWTRMNTDRNGGCVGRPRQRAHGGRRENERCTPCPAEPPLDGAAPRSGPGCCRGFVSEGPPIALRRPDSDSPTKQSHAACVSVGARRRAASPPTGSGRRSSFADSRCQRPGAPEPS